MPGTRIRAPQDIEAAVNAVRTEIGKSVVGYTDQIEDFLVCLFSNGHLLIEGVPGVAKTTLAKAFAAVCGLSYKRIQFTQDLLPADLTGHYFYNQRTTEFEVRKGPLFADLVLADEINRAPPKTQSALLEAMQEQQITIEGNSFDLPRPFMVLATLNPIETEGVYPLPEAQIDRFMIKSTMDYLDQKQEVDILRMKNAPEIEPKIVLAKDAVISMRDEIVEIHAHPSILEYIESLARATRDVEELDLGLSPRGAIHLLQTSKAHAYLRGRTYVIPDDVKTLAHKVIDHRLILSPEAELGGMTRSGITDSILSSVTVPKGEFRSGEERKE
ncbi:MAG: MoxR family ATPase [Candidatus Thermoplasmatota archaeon]|nr:MoxR family ATPase [Candidatus Thermoplasmatota archaeon]